MIWTHGAGLYARRMETPCSTRYPWRSAFRGEQMRDTEVFTRFLGYAKNF
jgi:hypothetical protein